MSEIIHKSERGIVEVFTEDGEKRIRRTVNVEMPLYKILKNSECGYLPHIFSAEISDGKTVVTEEFIEGISLLDADPDENQVVQAMVQLCSAMEHIHGLGIIHRDIKPSNILLAEDGNIRLIDFEAARLVRDDKDKDTRYLGTDGFAPPEQYGFSQTDFRADIYAAGQTMKVLLGSLSAKPKYAKIIRKCTALDPAKRYQSAKALAAALTNKREKISVPALLTLTAAAVLFASFMSKEDPAENISDETGIITEAVTSAETEVTAKTEIETSAETEKETIAETEVTSETEKETTAETEVTTEKETEITSETLITTETETASEIITDEYGLPVDGVENSRDRYLMAYYGELSQYGVPENIPDYDRNELLFYPEDENAKILFVSKKELFDELKGFYMYFDMDGDGINEACWTYVDPELFWSPLYVCLSYGVPKDGSYLTLAGLLESNYFNESLLDENFFVQVTSFKNNGVGYAAITFGDKESFNITEIYTVIDSSLELIGSCWGETTASVTDSILSVYFADGSCNSYLLGADDLGIMHEYDYEEYCKSKGNPEY